jgi:hypothetical protein
MINTAKIHSNINDECYTPFDAVVPLIKHLPEWVKIVWCPCDKPESQIVKALNDSGRRAIATHIDDGFDFLKVAPSDPSSYDMIITNIPYSCKEKMIERCIQLGKPWALLLPLDSLCGNRRYNLYSQADVGCITLHKRLDFTGKKKNWFYNAWVCSWPEIKNKWIQE